MSRPLLTASCFALVQSLALPAYGQGHAHVHGRANLQVAIDGPVVTLALRSPLDGLVGFEHAPRTEKQRAAVRDMEERLRNGAAQFVLTPEAGCTMTSAKIHSPVLGERAASGAGKAEGKSEGAAGKRDKHESHGGGEHAELDADYAFRCSSPDSLKSVDVKLFESFPRLRRIDVQVLSARGQKAVRLAPRSRVASW